MWHCRFNIDNKYGRAALEATFKAIMGYEQPIVKPPMEYKGDFFKGKLAVNILTTSQLVVVLIRTIPLIAHEKYSCFWKNWIFKKNWIDINIFPC